MTLLDIAFAQRYLQAWESYHKGEKCTNSWYIAFEAAKNKNPIDQHIFPGYECSYQSGPWHFRCRHHALQENQIH
jgi:hypothetical protein